MDSWNSIRSGSKRFFSGNALARASGIVRDISMAYVFGTESFVALFFVAYRLSYFFRRSISGALHAVFISIFEEKRNENETAAQNFFQNTKRSTMYFLSPLIIFICIAMALFGYAFEKEELAILTIIMMPCLLFTSLHHLNEAFLQCHKIFFLPSAAPMLFNGIWVITTLWIGCKNPKYPMRILSLGLLIASIVQWMCTHFYACKHTLKIKTQPLFGNLLSDARTLIKPLIFGTLSISSAQLNLTFDAIFARIASCDGSAVLWYALKISQLPYSLVSISLCAAILPPLSRAVKALQLKNANAFLHTTLQKLILILLPTSLILIVLSYPLIKTLYAHGHFTIGSAKITSQALSCYAIGILPASIALILSQAFFAQKRFAFPMIASLLSSATNISLNFAFVCIFKLNATSVALATSLSSTMLAITLALFLFVPKKSPFSLRTPTLQEAT